MFDRDGNGFITAAELAQTMAKLGHALTVEELTGMIKEADADGDGRISFDEFSQAITSAAFHIILGLDFNSHSIYPLYLCFDFFLFCNFLLNSGSIFYHFFWC
ncbi:hypothetical protein ERO13_1Z049405v2 [Gossypium hirsutum]|nr:hypothetical protein ERO13_1Z049405v2 [Gossypium hirsutum]